MLKTNVESIATLLVRLERYGMVQITCEAGGLPERFRSMARVILQSCDHRGVSFGNEYVAVRAEIQEPTVSFFSVLCT